MTKLAPGSPLAIGLRFDDSAPDEPVGRVVMANRLAMLEWDDWHLAGQLRVSPLLYPPDRGLIEARGRTFDGLHGFLADSLPDNWGAALMRRRVERMGISWASLDAVDRLALVGEQGRGALVFAPATTPPPEIETLDLDALARQSRSILLGKDADLVETLAALAGASGGARPKIHVGFGPDGQISIDDGESEPGFESWIVKFPAVVDPDDIGAIEQAYAAMARAAGISMAESRLLPASEGSGHFATRRFDRPAPGQRLHMLSLAGAIEAHPEVPSVDYDGFLRATFEITRDVRDVEEAFRRMVFNVLASNRDDHTRQHAYLMDAAGTWRLAPAYDLTFSNGPGGEHYLAVAGEGRSPSLAHVEQVGRRHSLAPKHIAQIIDDVRGATTDWQAHARNAGVTQSVVRISERITQIAATF